MDGSSTLRDAKLYFASGSIEKSIEAFDKAESTGCDLSEVCLSRGAAKMALGLYKDAKEDFNRVVSINKDSERAYYFRGIAHAALCEYEKAIQDLTQSLIRNNNRGIAHLVRGLAYSELGQDTDAVLDFNSASAFSEAELRSFKQLFGEKKTPFMNTKALLAKENAPWNNLLDKESVERLRKLFD